jgi:hypothetical protein
MVALMAQYGTGFMEIFPNWIWTNSIKLICIIGGDLGIRRRRKITFAVPNLSSRSCWSADYYTRSRIFSLGSLDPDLKLADQVGSSISDLTS